MQFIYANGSEGPLSVATSVSWTIPTGDSSYRYMVALDIPTGPTGTVARRVYRTANMSADAATIDDPTLYFIAEIRNNVEEIYIDYSSTAGAPAPSRADSVVFPSSRARYCTVWQECLWLDGGSNAPQRIYWSNPQRPDQFSLTDYIDLGSDGGGIVGIHGYYRMLVILRERSVDIVTGDYQNGFQANTLATQIYCRSPRAVVIPNVGLAFVASDGIYVLTGGVEGGATLSVANMMEGLDPLIRSWTTDLISRAVAAYCPLTREAHFYLPSNGKDKSNLGLVYSVDRKGWTTRSGFPVGDITQLPSGYLVFGHHTGIEAASPPVPQAGLFVISGRRALGTAVTGDVELPRLAPLSIYQSAWHSWGAPMSKKQVLYVTLFVAATGDKPLTLEWAKDLQPNWTSVNAYRMQPADQDDLPVYGTAKIGDAVWSSVGLISVRYAVAVESCSYFSWRIQTRDDVVLVGYDMEYVVKGTTIIEGKQ